MRPGNFSKSWGFLVFVLNFPISVLPKKNGFEGEGAPNHLSMTGGGRGVA
jgi:hypothetical protein